MPRLWIGKPVWLDQIEQDELAYPALGRHLDVDVVVVGAGATGAAVAWRFAAAGIHVAVVEAGRVGRGSTTASTALLMQEPDVDFSTMVRRDRARARRVWALGAAALGDLVDTLRDLSIDCDLASCDSIYYALDAARAGALHEELRRRRAAHIQGRWLDAAAVRREAGFDAAGAIRTRGNAQISPYKACAGLIRAAAAAGARVFERSPVVRIRSSPDRVIVETKRGVVSASHVVFAAGYATPSLKRLPAPYRVMNTYVLASRRLSRSERRRIGLGPLMLWDTNRPYHYARWTPDDRLLVGGGDRPRIPEAKRHALLRRETTRLRDYFVRLFPALAEIEVEHAWEGLFATTPDSLPYIGPHPADARQLFALGFGGNGMTLGFLASRLLLDAYLGRPSRDLELFAFERFARPTTSGTQGGQR